MLLKAGHSRKRRKVQEHDERRSLSVRLSHVLYSALDLLEGRAEEGSEQNVLGVREYSVAEPGGLAKGTDRFHDSDGILLSLFVDGVGDNWGREQLGGDCRYVQ